MTGKMQGLISEAKADEDTYHIHAKVGPHAHHVHSDGHPHALNGGHHHILSPHLVHAAITCVRHIHPPSSSPTVPQPVHDTTQGVDEQPHSANADVLGSSTRSTFKRGNEQMKGDIVRRGQQAHKTSFTISFQRHRGPGAAANTTAKIFPDTSVLHDADALHADLVLSGFGLSAFWFSMVVHDFFPGDTCAFLPALAHVTAIPMLTAYEYEYSSSYLPGPSSADEMNPARSLSCGQGKEGEEPNIHEQQR
ncbi:hypothetical protein BDN67DRAFT_982770 [Paxillus ammoniavirescens]|nr:hypothetical protein BDN67DRAFT_982770 [Paxillus ammoniavirescens]